MYACSEQSYFCWPEYSTRFTRWEDVRMKHLLQIDADCLARIQREGEVVELNHKGEKIKVELRWLGKHEPIIAHGPGAYVSEVPE